MIKLLWNTHNQKKSTSKDKQIVEKLDRDYVWGIYHQKNSNLWVYEILQKVKYKVAKNGADIEKNDVLIVVDSSIEEKIELYIKLKLICSKIFLFHLGDESGFYDTSLIYKNCDFVWRTFCSNKYFNNDHVKCIPIGYKSGVVNKKQINKKYKWAFVGTPHKSSRHDLLFQLSAIKPFFCHKTEKFDKKIISVEQMSDALSSTEFIPCPNGFVHPETYRLYEALECGCIPIVENAYQYYDRLFPNNPFLKINQWSEAKSIINGWEKRQIESKKEECENWWKKYKDQLQNSIRDKITL